MDDNRLVFSKLDTIWNYWIYNRHYFWKMKKLLRIVVLVLFLSGNAHAKCLDDLNPSWKYIDFGFGKEMQWSVKNTGNKSIIITKFGLKSKDGLIMVADIPTQDYSKGWKPISEDNFYLKPFGVTSRRTNVKDLNLDVAGSGFINCKYGTRPVLTWKEEDEDESESSGSSKSLLKKLLGKN